MKQEMNLNVRESHIDAMKAMLAAGYSVDDLSRVNRIALQYNRITLKVFLECARMLVDAYNDEQK